MNEKRPRIQESDLHAALVEAVVASTPEEWTSAVLELTRISPGTGHFEHSISSPEDHPPVAPCDAVYEHSYRLDAYLQKRGGALQRARYTMRYQKDVAEWTYEVEISY